MNLSQNDVKETINDAIDVASKVDFSVTPTVFLMDYMIGTSIDSKGNLGIQGTFYN